MRRLPAVGVVALAGVVVLTAASTAGARGTILDEDAATIARAAGIQPDGTAGLGPADNVFQVATTPAALPPGHRIARVVGDDLLGRDAAGMAAALRAAIRASDARRVVVNEVGADFRGDEGVALASALAILARERVSKSSRDVRSRRVHLYVSDPAALLTDPQWSGARGALVRAGGVWLRTTPASGRWTSAQWLVWPSETARLLARDGSSARRAHVLFGPGDQDVAWRHARTGSACAVLANGPGSRRVGADITAFVARFRALLPPPATKAPPPCLAAPTVADATATALEAAAERESGGLVLPPLAAPRSSRGSRPSSPCRSARTRWVSPRPRA